MNLNWQDPPPQGRGRGPKSWFAEVAPLLRDKPGVWALVKTYPTATRARTRTAATRKNWPAFEFATRGCDVYARYVGGES